MGENMEQQNNFVNICKQNNVNIGNLFTFVNISKGNRGNPVFYEENSSFFVNICKHSKGRLLGYYNLRHYTTLHYTKNNKQQQPGSKLYTNVNNRGGSYGR